MQCNYPSRYIHAAVSVIIFIILTSEIQIKLRGANFAPILVTYYWMADECISSHSFHLHRFLSINAMTDVERCVLQMCWRSPTSMIQMFVVRMISTLFHGVLRYMLQRNTSTDGNLFIWEILPIQSRSSSNNSCVRQTYEKKETISLIRRHQQR